MKCVILAILPLVMLSACTHKFSSIKSEQPQTLHKDFLNDGMGTEVIQTGRYTLVELEDPTKNYVLDQVIDTYLPKNLSFTVKEGMEYVLNQSGFLLCHNAEVNVLYDKKLPKIHYKFGPIKLSDALRIMAGPAWQLTIDDVEREVCFKLNKGYYIQKHPLELTPAISANNNKKQFEPYQMPSKTIESNFSNTEKLIESQQLKDKGKAHD